MSPVSLHTPLRRSSSCAALLSALSLLSFTQCSTPPGGSNSNNIGTGEAGSENTENEGGTGGSGTSGGGSSGSGTTGGGSGGSGTSGGGSSSAGGNTKHHERDKDVVEVYLLLDTLTQLKAFTDDLAKVPKANFNRLILAFVRPTLPSYTSGNLAKTGLLGYFGDGDGKGADAFTLLKAAVKQARDKNIHVLLSIGGWNYSCKAGTEQCKAPDTNYDYFPDPNEPSEQVSAAASYPNLVKLAKDLGVDGLDIDYEEIWHADQYAVAWKAEPWATSAANNLKADPAGVTYDTLLKHGTQSGQNTSFIMPKTVDKVAAFLRLLMDNPLAKDFLFSVAIPPGGLRPIMSFRYGDSADAADDAAAKLLPASDHRKAVDTYGGVWWKGNLKGLWYNLALKDPALVDRLSDIGLMTYDLDGQNPKYGVSYTNAPLDLVSQVKDYMQDGAIWLKALNPAAATLAINDIGKVTFTPAHLKIKPAMLFGFEVNEPAYPAPGNPGQLRLTNELVDKILQQEKDSGGVIIWQMYSQKNKDPKSTTSKYTIQQSCKTFIQDDDFDCNADFPSAP